jgi:hypothetical protein
MTSYLTTSVSPQQVGLIWEILVRNYYISKGLATFRVSEANPLCDLVAFQPIINMSRWFPRRNLERSPNLETIARKDYHRRYGYDSILMPSINEGFVQQAGQLISLQTHLLAFQRDHLRIIWTRKRTKKRAARIWDKKLCVSNLEFIECKAVKRFSIESFRRGEQFQRQLRYAELANARYVTINRTPEGAERFLHTTDKTISVGFIIKWNELFR